MVAFAFPPIFDRRLFKQKMGYATERYDQACNKQSTLPN